MIEAIFQSRPVFLLTFPPDWQRRVTATFEKLTSRVTGNSAREDREELGDTLRASLSYETLLHPAEAAACRDRLHAWDSRPILCPFWPAETLAADYASASVQGGLRVWWEPGWTAYSLNTDTAPTHVGATSACRTAPVIYGKFEDFPQRRIVSGRDDEVVTFAVIDHGPAAYALTPRVVAIANGAMVNGETVPLLTVPFSWGSNESTIEVRQKTERVGFGRESADTVYPQAPRTKDTLHFEALAASEIAELLGIFHERGASVRPLWIQAPQGLATADRSYGRFYGDRLSLAWLRPSIATELAECSVEFLSLPTERTPPASETYGTSLGPHEKRWFGYKVACGASTWFFTSRESAVAGPGGTYEPRPISHGTITEEINLAVNDCSLTVFAWPECPFALLATKLNAEPMTVTIYEGPLADAAHAAPIYTGTAQAPRRTGLKLTVKLRGPSALLALKGPRALLQETCRAVLGDSRCRVDLSSRTVVATVSAFGGDTATTSIAAGTHPAGYFRNGYIQRSLAGISQRIAISYSDDADGFLRLQLANAPVPSPVAGESWSLVPGCDGTYETCASLFSNQVNFRGFPHLPRTNPAMVPIKDEQKGKKQ